MTTIECQIIFIIQYIAVGGIIFPLILENITVRNHFVDEMILRKYCVNHNLIKNILQCINIKINCGIDRKMVENHMSWFFGNISCSLMESQNHNIE